VSPAQDFSEPVRQVEDGLLALVANTSQNDRGAAIGRHHSQISRLEEAYTTRQVDSYLQAYGPERLLLLMRAFPEFKAVVDAATQPDAAAADPSHCDQSLVDVTSSFTKSIETIVQRLPQGTTIVELREIEENLASLLTVVQRTRINIARRIRNNGSGD
jgi:hypothetical protein